MPIPSSPEKEAEWKHKIQRQKESGLSIQRWCKENQISSASYHYWKDCIFPKPPVQKSSFVELPPCQKATLTLEYSGVLIHLDPDFPPELLRRCLNTLKEITC